MKKLFTNLLNHQALSLMGLLLLAGNVSMNADEYKSMIRYDRVWECYCDDFGSENFKCMKFDGTEEILGKTWHRLVSFKDIKRVYNPEAGTFLYEGMEDTVWQHEGYMREEDGVVYTLVEMFGEERFGERYGTFTDFSGSNSNEIVECVLYDFNREVGEYYEAITFIGPFKSAERTSFKVLSKDFIDIEGDVCRRIEVAGVYYDLDGDERLFEPHTFVEGIGAGESGCLNYHEYGDSPTMEWVHNDIARTFDMDGNVIFISFEGCCEDLQYGSFSDMNGIDSVETKMTLDATLYDLMGRRISNPAPGQLYIKDGKKFIGK